MKEYAVEDKDGYTTFPLGIVVALPFLLYVNDNESFHITIKEHTVTLLFEKQTRGEDYYENRLAFPVDQVDIVSSKGILHYSEARVFFTDVLIEPNGHYHFPDMGRPNKLKSFYENVILTDDQMKHYENEGDDFKLTKVALKTLNQFISHYRFETRYYFTPNVRLEDYVVVKIMAMRFRPMFKASPDRPDSEINNVALDQWSMFPFTGIRGHLPLINVEQRNRILSRVNSGEEVPVCAELILSANGHFQEGNYRQAIIDVQTAFEVEIKNCVERHLASQGMPCEKIENILEGGIVNLLRKHYPKCPEAKPFMPDTDEYKKWDWAYKKRIAMTHSGSNVPEQDARLAFAYYDATFRYLFDGNDSWINLPELPINLLSGSDSRSPA